MRGYYLVLLLLSVALIGRTAGGRFAVADIPPELLRNANAVIRQDDHQVILKTLDRMVIRTHFAVTVFNEAGSELAALHEWYDRFISITSISGALYDSAGKKIKSLRRNDVKDLGASSEINLADEGRLKVHRFFHTTYPYTVEYIIETVKKESMFFPQWIPVPDEWVSVEKSSMRVEVPSNYALRYRAFNYAQDPVITAEDKKVAYAWQLSDYTAITRGYAAPSWRKITPTVILAPSEFMIDNYKGNMTNWRALGLFQSELNKGRDILPEAIKQKVASLISGAATRREKVERLYQYLQQNTRYVSVQLGIGGWRPYDAAYVAEKGYGDCKALSNYMLSLLKEAGITSYYALIRSGDPGDDILPDFPARQFNHVILCVPNDADTIWLECTSQTAVPGYLGRYTGNRYALLVTGNGGQLVRTPKYGLKDNCQVRRINATLDESGHLSVAADTYYSGLEQDVLHTLINDLSKDQMKSYLEERMDFATFDISRVDYHEEKSSLPVIREQLDIAVRNYATITGKRIFIQPNIMTRTYRKPSADSTRKFGIELMYDYAHADTVVIELPPGYETETIPPDMSLSSPFGKYQCSVKLVSNKLYYYRSLDHYSGQFSAGEYPELVRFWDSVYRADRNHVVLVKKEATTKSR